MKIKNTIVEQVNSIRGRRRIGHSLDISDQMVYMHLKENRENGVLTKLSALKCIAEQVGMNVEEILDYSTEVTTNIN